MLRDDIERYTQLSGEDGTHTPIIKIGAYLDGYDKAMENIDKMIVEIEKLRGCSCNISDGIIDDVVDIIEGYCKENTDGTVQ